MLAVICCAASAQTFDVASIRESVPDSRGSRDITPGPASLTVRNMSVLGCIAWAYRVQGSQISGPPWLDEEKFDIAAKAPGRADENSLRLMLRALLADRFALKLRIEKKEMAVYSLTVGKNGPNFHDATAKDSSKFRETQSEEPSHLGEDKTGLMAERIRLSEMADLLSEPLQRPVIDNTGLKGRYDIRLDVAAYMTNSEGHLDAIGFILSGFQTQLGLKLESGKENVDYLVIESVNKTPTQN